MNKNLRIFICIFSRTGTAEKFTKIAVDKDVVAADGTVYDVLFIGTDTGKVLKVRNSKKKVRTKERDRYLNMFLNPLRTTLFSVPFGWIWKRLQIWPFKNVKIKIFIFEYFSKSFRNQLQAPFLLYFDTQHSIWDFLYISVFCDVTIWLSKNSSYILLNKEGGGRYQMVQKYENN